MGGRKDGCQNPSILFVFLHTQTNANVRVWTFVFDLVSDLCVHESGEGGKGGYIHISTYIYKRVYIYTYTYTSRINRYIYVCVCICRRHVLLPHYS